MKQLLSLLLICSTFNVLAADKAFEGVVLDKNTKKPLPFTNIVVVGQYRGTVSNAEGNFVLDRSGIVPTDTILFSFVGYETVVLQAHELNSVSKIYLKLAAINLKEVQVSSKTLSAREIIRQVNKNYDLNYPVQSDKKHIFFHKFEQFPFPDENSIIVKNSDFTGLDRQTINDLMKLMPSEFIDYQDAIVDIYTEDEQKKLVPVKAISLMEGSYEELFKEFEKRLSSFFEDIQQSHADSNVYYQFRTGVFSHKLKPNSLSDSIWNETMADTINYTEETKLMKETIQFLFKDYSTREGKNWEFINNPARYRYRKDELTLFNDELVYKISFTPKGRGLFEGTIYVSMTDYAILQLDFAYAEGKQSERIKMMGFSHSMNYKKGRVIFEKGKKGYFVKYISAQQNESGSIDRTFSVLRKEKRFLKDKELNQIKLETQMYFDVSSKWEILVLDREEISSSKFQEIEEPLLMKFKKEYAYTPEMWDDRTVLVPNAELKQVKRKD